MNVPVYTVLPVGIVCPTLWALRAAISIMMITIAGAGVVTHMNRVHTISGRDRDSQRNSGAWTQSSVVNPA